MSQHYSLGATTTPMSHHYSLEATTTPMSHHYSLGATTTPMNHHYSLEATTTPMSHHYFFYNVFRLPTITPPTPMRASPARWVEVRVHADYWAMHRIMYLLRYYNSHLIIITKYMKSFKTLLSCYVALSCYLCN